MHRMELYVPPFVIPPVMWRKRPCAAWSSRPIRSVWPQVKPGNSEARNSEARDSVAVFTWLGPGVSRLLAYAEDYELRRLDHRNANQTYQPTVIQIVLSHRSAITPHEEGFF